MTRNRKFTQLTALAGLAALAACDSSTAGGMGTVRVYLTATPQFDAISALMLGEPPVVPVENASVTIGCVELMPGHVPLTPPDCPEQTFDLLLLNEGLSEMLAEAAVPVGDYEQLRVIVVAGSVKLTTGQTFDHLTVPSGMQTGIKLNFSGPIHVDQGVEDLFIVFDLARSFVLQGPPTNPLSVSFKPVIHAASETWPSIAGVVTLPMEVTAVVTVQALIGTDVMADTVFSATGPDPVPYRLRFLQDGGQYTVKASVAAPISSEKSQPNVTAPATGVNFTFP